MTTQDLNELESLTGNAYKERLCELAPELIRAAKQSQRLREALEAIKPFIEESYFENFVAPEFDSAVKQMRAALASPSPEPSSDPCQLEPPSNPRELLPISTAPKDGTLILLWLANDEEKEHPLEDTADLSVTIGFNNFNHDGEDTWKFAGWCWSHDHYTEGKGTPVAWIPIPRSAYIPREDVLPLVEALKVETAWREEMDGFKSANLRVKATEMRVAALATFTAKHGEVGK